MPVAGGVRDPWVFDICEFDDGTGPALFLGGAFSHAGDIASAHIAKLYRPAPPCPELEGIPTMTAWGMVTLTLSLLAAGGVILYRRGSAPV